MTPMMYFTDDEVSVVRLLATDWCYGKIDQAVRFGAAVLFRKAGKLFVRFL
jgi:hypothetical protein